MKVYVINKGGEVERECFTSITAAADRVGCCRQTLSSQIKNGFYLVNGFKVVACDVVKVRR